MPRKKNSLPKITIKKTDKNTESNRYAKLGLIFLENLKNLTSDEVKIYNHILHMTVFEHVDIALFSVSDMHRDLNMRREKIARALNGLDAKGWVSFAGIGPNRKKYIKLNLINSIDDLNSQTSGIVDKVQVERNPCNLYPKNLKREVQVDRNPFNLPPPYLILEEPRKKLQQKKKMSLSFFPPCKKLLKIFPPELQKKPILKLIQNSLAGDKMPKRDFDFIKNEIEYFLEYAKTKAIKSPTGFLRSAIIEGFGNSAKELPKIGGQKKYSVSKILEDQKKIEDEINLKKDLIAHSERLKSRLYELPSCEIDRLKIRAIDSMNSYERKMYEVRKNEKTLERCILREFENEINEGAFSEKILA